VGTATLQLQEAIYAFLEADTFFADHGCAVYDEVPENAAFPFLVLSDGMETPQDVFSEKGRLTIFNIHIWSMAQGMEEMEVLFNRVDELLHYNSALPAMPGYVFIYGKRDTMTVQRDTDGLTRHLVARYVFLSEERI